MAFFTEVISCQYFLQETWLLIVFFFRFYTLVLIFFILPLFTSLFYKNYLCFYIYYGNSSLHFGLKEVFKCCQVKNRETRKERFFCIHLQQICIKKCWTHTITLKRSLNVANRNKMEVLKFQSSSF